MHQSPKSLLHNWMQITPEAPETAETLPLHDQVSGLRLKTGERVHGVNINHVQSILRPKPGHKTYSRSFSPHICLAQ